MAQILDQYGQPLQRETLAAPQTAKLSRLHQQFARHPVKGLTPAKLAAILEAAERGDMVSQGELYEDMEERDGHLLCEMGKRKRALLTLDWDIVPPRNPSAAESAAAEYAKELVQDVPELEDVILDAADAIGKGYACLEIEWQRLGAEWLPKAITHRPQRWFQLDRATRQEIRLRDASVDGAPLNPFGWIVHTHRAKSGYLDRAALFRVLTWPYLFKWFSARDMAEFLEIHGLPLRVGTYPIGASDEEKRTLLQAVVSIGHAAAGIIPEGMMVEFKEAAKGSHEPYAWMVDWCERTQSKAILGQVLSAEAKSTGLGSGVANLQSEVRDDLRDSDAIQIARTLSRDLIYPLLALNGRAGEGLRRCPRWQYDTNEPEDLALYADALPKLVAIGVQVPRVYAHEKLKIPLPQEGEEVLGAAPAPAAEIPSPAQRGRAGEAALKAQPPPQDEPDTADLQAARLAIEATPAFRPVLTALDRIVGQATSLEALRDDLVAAYGHLPIEDLQGVMTRAFAAADAAGRFDVVTESNGAGRQN